MADLPPVDLAAVQVLTEHQRRDIGSCICGWGVDTGALGRSHPLHVWRELQRVLPDHDATVRAKQPGATKTASDGPTPHDEKVTAHGD